MQRSKESKEKGQGPPFFFPVEELRKYFRTSSDQEGEDDDFLIKSFQFPTEEEAAATPGSFLEGTAHIYKFV